MCKELSIKRGLRHVRECTNKNVSSAWMVSTSIASLLSLFDIHCCPVLDSVYDDSDCGTDH